MATGKLSLHTHTDNFFFPGQGTCCLWSSSFRKASSGIWMTFPSCTCLGVGGGQGRVGLMRLILVRIAPCAV